MTVTVVPVYVANDRVVGTPKAAIKALFLSDFIRNGSYPFEADSLVSVVKKHSVFIDDDLVKVCENYEEATELCRKIEKAAGVLEGIGMNEPVSLLNLFEHRDLLGELDEDAEEPQYQRPEL